MNIDTLKGIGLKTSKIFNNNGIMTINDLMSYYPFRYDLIKRSNINELVEDDKIIIDGIVESNPSLFFFNKKMNKMLSVAILFEFLMMFFILYFIESKVTKDYVKLLIFFVSMVGLVLDFFVIKYVEKKIVECRYKLAFNSRI